MYDCSPTFLPCPADTTLLYSSYAMFITLHLCFFFWTHEMIERLAESLGICNGVNLNQITYYLAYVPFYYSCPYTSFPHFLFILCFSSMMYSFLYLKRLRIPRCLVSCPIILLFPAKFCFGQNQSRPCGL
ncbi:hypothetical protein BDV06DRAFT_29935 [Aspergillus oleicola]